MTWPIRPVDKTKFTDFDGMEYIYDLIENRWDRQLPAPSTSGGSGSGSSGGISAGSQTTKLGVTATSGAPYTFNITVPFTSDFNRLPVEVLKFTPGATGQVVTECNFNNADASSFNADPLNQVVFDGTMHLQTSYSTPMTDGGALGSGHLWSAVIDKTQFKSIESVSVS